MSKIKYFLILILLILAFVVRLYKIDNPIADWHSWRQADTASVTQNILKNRGSLLVPTYHDLSNIPSGKKNPQGFRMVEFPIYNQLHAYLYQLIPNLGVDKAGRLTSVILSLISILFVFLIADHLSGFFVGFMAAFFMAFLPFNIYYSRVVLPEPLMTASLLSSFWFLLVAVDKKRLVKRVNFFLSALLFSVALLTKPYALFFSLPHLAIIIREFALKQLSWADILGYAAISLTPFAWWRNHINTYPEGIPASDWLFNNKGIRFRPAWFRWLFGERLGKLILGVYGTGFFLLGLVSKPLKEGITYWLWALGILIYFSVMAGGNVQHDYYQAIIIPFISVILAKGVMLMVSLSRNTYSRLLTLLVSAFAIVLMLFLSWYDIQGYYQVNNSTMVEAGKVADAILPKDAKVIAPYNGDTAFLYQTRRSGWPIGYSIDEKIKDGATHYVTVVYDDEARALEKQYTVLAKTDKYLIIQLSK